VAYFLRNTVLLTPPKCGSDWIRNLVEKCYLSDKYKFTYINNCTEIGLLLGLSVDESGSSITKHSIPLDDSRFSAVQNVVCFIRHPLSWYKSWWCFRRSVKWSPRRPVCQECPEYPLMDVLCGVVDRSSKARSCFNTYVDKLIDVSSSVGYFSRFFAPYVSVSKFCIKLEDFPNSLFSVLDKCSEKYKRNDVLRSKPIHVTGSLSSNSGVKFRLDQAKKLMLLDKGLAQRFGYTIDLVPHLIGR